MPSITLDIPNTSVCVQREGYTELSPAGGHWTTTLRGVARSLTCGISWSSWQVSCAHMHISAACEPGNRTTRSHFMLNLSKHSQTTVQSRGTNGYSITGCEVPVLPNNQKQQWGQCASKRVAWLRRGSGLTLKHRNYLHIPERGTTLGAKTLQRNLKMSSIAILKKTRWSKDLLKGIYLEV